MSKTVTSRFVLKGDNQLNSSFSKAQKQLGSLAKKAALFGTVAAAAMAAVVKSSISFADNIGKTSDAIGLGVEEFQEYEFAAKRAGIETGQFSSNMTAFVKRVGEAKAGLGPLVSGLKNLNPVLLENLKNSTNQGEAFRFVAQAIQKSDSATERAAIANAAFSRSGIQMILMLRDGAKGLDDMSQTARDLGAVLDEELVRNAELAADKMGDLQRVLQIRVATVVTENADSIIALAESVITFMAVAPGFIKFMKDEFNAALGFIDNDDFLRLGDKLADLKKELADVEGAPFGALGDFFGGGRPEEIARINEEIRVTINLLDEIEFKRRDAAKLKTAVNVPAIVSSLPEQFVGPSREGADERRNDLQRDYLRLIQSTRTAQENHTAVITQIGNLYTAGLIPSAEEYADLINRINDGFIETPEKVEKIIETFSEMNEFAVQAARNIQTQFADFLFDPFDDGLKGMVKGFANAIRQMMANIAAAQLANSITGFIAGLIGSAAGAGAGGSGGSGGGGGLSFGGTRDHGGRGYPGNVYEITPNLRSEFFVPDSAGTFIPNTGQLGGNSITVNIDARQTDDPGRLLALVPVISAQIEQNIMLKRRRGML